MTRYSVLALTVVGALASGLAHSAGPARGVAAAASSASTQTHRYQLIYARPATPQQRHELALAAKAYDFAVIADPADDPTTISLSGLGHETAGALTALSGVTAIQALSTSVQDNAPAHLDRLDQDGGPGDRKYHYDYTGRNVTVYVVDSGVNIAHPDFGGRASKGAFDVFAANPPAQDDMTGHGSSVAGVVAGHTRGVAKDARIVSVRVTGSGSGGTFSPQQVADALQWIKNRAVLAKGRSVVNMSLQFAGDATTPGNAALTTAVNDLIAANVVVVVSAGNTGAANQTIDACQFIPYHLNGVFAVGNASEGGLSASRSGPCVDAYANGTVSTTAGSGSGFVGGFGTSNAAPQFAGIAALVLEQFPALSVAGVNQEMINRTRIGRINMPNAIPGSHNRLARSIVR